MMPLILMSSAWSMSQFTKALPSARSSSVDCISVSAVTMMSMDRGFLRKPVSGMLKASVTVVTFLNPDTHTITTDRKNKGEGSIPP